MKRFLLPAVALFSSILMFGGAPAASAQMLPQLDDDPWLGYFIGYGNKRWRFGMTSQGKMNIVPLDKKGESKGHGAKISVRIQIDEMNSNGKASAKLIDASSLESKNEATDSLDKVVITGKTTGNASFEMTVEQVRGEIMIGGRVTGAGDLKKPLRFALQTSFPKAYKEKKPKEEREVKKWEKQFERQLKGDKLVLKWTDGTRKRFSFDEEVDLSSKEVSGPGVEELLVDSEAYDGRQLAFSASENSMMKLEGGAGNPIFKGYKIHWAADPGKDPEGKARFRFKVK